MADANEFAETLLSIIRAPIPLGVVVVCSVVAFGAGRGSKND